MFTHLNVVSHYSLRYGIASPEAVVESAKEKGMDAVALTDRDGLYGAVRFAQACVEAGIQPIIGCNLPIQNSGLQLAAPMIGGASLDLKPARFTAIAAGYGGMVALNRLVSAHHEVGISHLAIKRVCEIAQETNSGELVILLGPNSDLGRAISENKPALAKEILQTWRSLGAGIYCEIVSHRALGETQLAAKMWQFANQNHVQVVLTNAVRHLKIDQGKTADILDATRKLVPLSRNNVERKNNEAVFKSEIEMQRLACEIAQVAGFGIEDVWKILQSTEALAQKCYLDPKSDLGIGEIFVPELDVIKKPPLQSFVDEVWSRPPAVRRTKRTIDREAKQADVILRKICEAKLPSDNQIAKVRLEDELETISTLGFASFFLTVAEVVKLARERNIRVAARGSGAGSYVNHLLGISVLNPLEHGLIMERFLSPLRSSLPDIDIDVESHRRLEVYEAIFERFGVDRVACVSMMDTYRVRNAIRDVGSALGLPPTEIDMFAKSFPRIRARNARAALEELPELAKSGFGQLAKTGQLNPLLELIESLDGLPRHVAMHPCGVLLSDSALLDRTPVQPSGGDFPMSQYDKDDVETLGFLKLDVLGIRMQSAMSYAVAEIERVENVKVELDEIPLDDAKTFELIQSAKTLGMFQIESPGQRELIGKFAPSSFNDIIIDISLFRPGPVKSDMITPFLNARQGWKPPQYIHPNLIEIVEETSGVVVFHEQVIKLISALSGCTWAEADEVRRSFSDTANLPKIRAWLYPKALKLKYDLDVIEEVWAVLKAFASFGFCKAHAGAFALPTYQSAWLKTHHRAAFYAGILTHDPGMYPKRLIVEDARQMGIPILGLDINHSKNNFTVEEIANGYAVRMALSQVKSISDAEVDSIVEAQPFVDINDMWQRSNVSRPVMQSLVLAGAFDTLHNISNSRHQNRNATTRRDLYVHVNELSRNHVADRNELLFAPIAETAPLITGLPEMDELERVQAELEILGIDVSHHVIDFYKPLLSALNVVPSSNLLNVRSNQEIFVAGVKVACQTPPVRSGKRVIFVTLDDSTGPIDAAFFENTQADFSHTLLNSWTLLMRGVTRRTGPRGISLRGTGCWSLADIQEVFNAGAKSPWGFDPDAGVQSVMEFIDNSYSFDSNAQITAPKKLWHTSPGVAG